jgi:acetyl esterase
MSKALSRVSLLASILAGGALAVSTPLHAQEVRGLEVEGRAPTSVVLHVDGLSYADCLRAAGNVVDLELVRGVTHDFIKMGRHLPEALTALDVCAKALRQHLLP